MSPDEQKRSRKRQQAAFFTLEKKTICDILCICHLADIIISNDAKSCYNIIVLWVATLAMQRCGLPASVVTSMVMVVVKQLNYGIIPEV